MMRQQNHRDEINERELDPRHDSFWQGIADSDTESEEELVHVHNGDDEAIGGK